MFDKLGMPWHSMTSATVSSLQRCHEHNVVQRKSQKWLTWNLGKVSRKVSFSLRETFPF